MTAPHPEAALSAREAENGLTRDLWLARDMISEQHSTWSPEEGYVHHGKGKAAIAALDRAIGLLSTAHTATAGDGGLRKACLEVARTYDARRDATRAFHVAYDADADVAGATFASQAAQEAHTRATGALVEAARRFAALAQPPAVQAPAGEDVALAKAITQACFDPGVLAGPRGDRTTDGWRADAVLAVLGARTAPPVPAGPVGEEALIERACEAQWEIARAFIRDRICIGRDPGEWSAQSEDCKAVSRLETKAAFQVFVSHPTIGQETVATPRDGGVREARWGIEDTGDAIWVGPMRSDGCKIDRVVYFKDDLGLHRKGYVAQVKADARLIVDSVNAALSAPGSAGPGETVLTPIGEERDFWLEHFRFNLVRILLRRRSWRTRLA